MLQAESEVVVFTVAEFGGLAVTGYARTMYLLFCDFGYRFWCSCKLYLQGIMRSPQKFVN